MTTNSTVRFVADMFVSKRYFFTQMLLALSFVTFAQSASDEKQITIQWQSIKNTLLAAPQEKSQNATESAVIVSIPTLKNGYQDYKFIESTMFQNGTINDWIPTKCYQGYRLNDMNAVARIVVDQFGLHIAMLNNSNMEFIDPINASINTYKIYSKTGEQVLCENENLRPSNVQNNQTPRVSCNSYGGTRRDYKVAVAVTGEYYVHSGGTLAKVQSDITALLNVINVIYEKQLAIHLDLISNNNSIIYTNGATDPFTPLANGNASATQAKAGFSTAAVTAVVPVASYDTGQVLHYESTGGGWSGQASLSAVCTANKYGWNQERGGSTFNAGAFGGVMGHEIGHNFAAEHPFFGSGCGASNISATSAYEPGSGTSYMSYQGVCGVDDIGNDRDDYFHIVNLNQIRAFVVGTGNCATNTATGNSAPVSNSNPTSTTYTIPKGTPFTLTGSGSDPDSNPITYCWEQYDTPGVGTGGTPVTAAAVNATWPCFRSFPPISTPSRTFPQLSDILSNTATNGEVLPQTARTMKFRLTVRDAFTNGGLAMGSFACDETSVIVSNLGPFDITSQNTATTWAANGSNTANITWNVNGTTGAPVSCANVSILFSTDGGNTFPYTLVASTPNNGSATITIPSYPTSTGRIKVQCASGNIFFDINNANITITSSCVADASTVAPAAAVTAAAPGAAVLNLGLAPQYGTNISSFSGTIAATDPSMTLTFMQTPANTCATPYSNAPLYKTHIFYVSTAGVYTISLGAGTLGSKVMNLYNTAFNPSNTCGGWMTSNATWAGGASSVVTTGSMSASLVPGVQYTVVMSGFSATNVGTYAFSIAPAANVYNGLPNPGATFSYNYVVVNTATNNIVSIGATSNLTNTTTYPGGMYQVYGLSFSNASSGLLAGYVGGSFSTFQAALANLTGGICADLSTNAVSVTISAPACTPPTVSTQPNATQTVCEGTSVSLTVVATGGTAPYTYIWKKGTTTVTNSASITGASTATLVINPTIVTDAGSYICVITDNLSCSVTSTAGVVNINAIPGAPSVTTPVTYCQNATATPLTATGSSLLWYATPTGGLGSATAPTPIITTAGSTTSYVSQTVSTCESPRAALVVTVTATPAAPTVTTPVTYCQNATASALTATGTALKWYTVATGGTALAAAPTPVTTTAGSTTYYVSQTVSTCESPRASIVVTITATPAAPTVTTPVTYCQNAAASALTATGTALLWYTVATGGTGSATAPTPLTTTVGSTTYYVSQTVSTCESPRAAIVVTVTATPAAPTVSTPITYCQNATATPLTATGTALQWYTAATGGSALASAPTPITTAIGSTTYYVSQTISTCESPRAAIVVNISAGLAAPTVTTPLTYCQGVTAPALTATPSSGASLLWYTVATGGTGSATAITPSTLSAGSTTYYVSQIGNGCPESARAAIVVNVTATPAAPTVTTPVTYCQGATASALTATGTALQWYTVATGGTALASAPTPSTAAAGFTTYYVSQTVSTCESPRAAIVVTITATPAAPTATTPVTYCQGATASALTATGSSLLWYTAATGGTALASAPTPSTAAAGSTTYYVSQTVSTCESPRASIVVTITATPAAPTTAPVTYCQGATAAPLTATGTALLWYSAATGGVGSATAPTPITSAIGTTTYYVSQTLLGCESPRSSLVVTIGAGLNAPTVTTPVTYCQNATAVALTATPSAGASLLWYTVATGGTGSATAITPSTSSAGSTTYYVSQIGNGCPESARATIVVNVTATPAAPVVTTPVTYCQNAASVALTATGTGLLWYVTPTGGPSSATAPTPPTATVGSATAYVSQTVSGCESTRAAIVVTVNAIPTAPAVTTPVTYCQGATASALTATGTSLLWYTAATGGVGSATAPTPLTTTAGSTTYYVSQTISSCESPRAAIVVTINSTPLAPSVSNVVYCQGATPAALTATGTSLLWYTAATGGVGSATAPTPSTAAAGMITYYVSQMVMGCESPRVSITVTVNATPIAPIASSPSPYCVGAASTQLSATGTALLWYTTPTGGVGSATAPTPSTVAAGTTNHYVSQTISGCESPRTNISVVVNAIPAAPTVTTPVNYCQTQTASALTATGSGLLWYAAATGGIGSTTAPTPSTVATGSTTYYVSQTVTGCESPRASIVVTVSASTPAPTTAPITICQGSSASTLTATGSSLLWYMTVTGGTGSAIAPTPSTGTAGTTTFYVSQTLGTCPESSRASLVVTVTAKPAGPTATTPVTYCQGAPSAALTATGSGLKWYTAPVGGVGSASAPTPSTGTAGSTTYYVSQTVATCESDRTAIVVTVNTIPAAPVTPLGFSLCQNVVATPLMVAGSNIKWYDSGFTLLATAPTPVTTVAPSTSFYFVSQTVNGCESTQSLFTVEIKTTAACFTPTCSNTCSAFSVANIPNIYDPCTNRPDDYFNETVIIEAPSGQVWTVSSGSLLNATTLVVIPVGTVLTETPKPGSPGTSLYSLNGAHKNGVGYTEKFKSVSYPLSADLMFTNVCYKSTTMTANDKTTVSLSAAEGCMKVILPANILTSSVPSGAIVEIYESNNVLKPGSPKLSKQDIGKTFTVVVKDGATPPNTTWGLLIVEDKEVPQVTCPDTLKLVCNKNVNESIAPVSFGNGAMVGDMTAPTFTDCSNLTLTYTDMITDFQCPVPATTATYVTKEIMRTWKAVDAYGNVTICTQVIQFRRPSLMGATLTVVNASFDCAASFTKLANGNPAPAISGVPLFTIGAASFEANALCDLSLGFTDVNTPTCGNGYKVIRTWTVSDNCSNQTFTTKQIIKVEDQKDPVFTASSLTAASITVRDNCKTKNAQLPFPSATDNCDNDLTKTFKIKNSAGVTVVNGTATAGNIAINDLEMGNYTIYYAVADDCGNNTVISQSLKVVDDLAPIAVCRQTTKVAVTLDGTATLQAKDLDEGSSDNCCLDPNGFEISKDNGATYLKELYLNCNDVNIMVAMRVKDCNGNSNVCMANVLVEDKLPPVIFAKDTMVVCGNNAEAEAWMNSHEPQEKTLISYPSATNAGYFDNCKNVTLAKSDIKNIDNCGIGTYVRSWTAKDKAGKTATATQTITSINMSAYEVTFPADVPLVCNSNQTYNTDPTTTGEPKIVYTNKSCPLVGVEHKDEIFDVVPGACYKILRTWKVINWCQNTDVNGLDADRGAECKTAPRRYSNVSPATAAIALLTDVNNPLYKYKAAAENIVANTCAGYDDDGYMEYVQVILVTDNVPPVWSTVQTVTPATVGKTCSVEIKVTEPKADDCTKSLTYSAIVYKVATNGAETKVDETATFPKTWAFDAVSDKGNYVVRYKASDKCGNFVTSDKTFAVKDIKKPTPVCFSGLSTTLMPSSGMVMIMATQLNAGSYDNCTPDNKLKFRIEDVKAGIPVMGVPTTEFITINCLGTKLLRLWVIDEAGNADFCEAFVIIQQNMPLTIGMTVDSCKGGIQMASISTQVKTEKDNAIENVAVKIEGNTALLKYSPFSGFLNFTGLVYGQNYTVTPELDENPLNGVSTYDLVLMNKHILGTQPFDSPYKWVAADVNKSGTVTTYDMVELRRLILHIDNDFKNNKSWRFVDKGFLFPTPNPLKTQIPEMLAYNALQNDEKSTFIGVKIGDINGSAKANSSMPVSDRTTTEVNLNIDNQAFTTGQTVKVAMNINDFKSIEGYQFTVNYDRKALRLNQIAGNKENFAVAEEGKIATSWNGALAQQSVVEFEFTALTNSDLKQVVTISSDVVRNEVYLNDGTFAKANLVFNGETAKNEFELFQNQPNPFNGTTLITFNSPSAGEYSLTVTDASGRTVSNAKGNAAKGLNEIKLEMPSNGIYYYTVKMADNIATKKMIVVE